MRPRKRILCVDSDEDDLGILAFLLETQGYRAIKATCVSEAATVLMKAPVELIIVSATIRIDEAITAVKILKGICPHTPLILLCNMRDLGDKFHRADMVLSRVYCPAAELLERIKILSARKRGPRKEPLPALPTPEVVAVAMGEARA